MSEKYIDLTPAIIRNWHTPAVVKGIRAAMQWLDEHPDQVPGRTITRSEVRDTLNGAVLVSGYGDDWERGFSTGLVVSGAKVIPDPEPTNAEQLKAVLDAIGDSTAGYREHLASKLDEAGVKAPGGDDD